MDVNENLERVARAARLSGMVRGLGQALRILNEHGRGAFNDPAADAIYQLMLAATEDMASAAAVEDIPPPPPMAGSVQCPHCKWGFAPRVIDQHVREKHPTMETPR